MFCAFCGTKLPDGAAFCPGCGNKVQAESAAGAGQEQKKTYDAKDMTSTLIYIKEVYGKNVFSGRDKLLAYFGDLAPTLQAEKGMLDRMAKRGIVAEFLAAENADEEAKRRLIAMKMTQLVNSEFIREDIAAKYLGILADVLGWGIRVEAPQPAAPVQPTAAPVAPSQSVAAPTASVQQNAQSQSVAPAPQPAKQAPAQQGRDENLRADAVGISRFHRLVYCFGALYAVTSSGKLMYSESYRELDHWNNIVSLAANDHMVGLRADGSVIAEGDNEKGECNVEGWRDIVAVACSNHGTVGVKRDGRAVTAGEISLFKINDISSWDHLVDVKGYGEVLGLKDDGTVITTDISLTDSLKGWDHIVEVDMGNHYAIGLRDDGTVVATRGLLGGGLGDEDRWTNISAVACGGFHAAALRKDGTVVATGENSDGQCNVEDWRDIVEIACDTFVTMGLKKDGTVVVTGMLDDSVKAEIKNMRLS